MSNNALAEFIQVGFFTGEDKIAVSLDLLAHKTLIVKAHRYHTAPNKADCLSLHCAMLVDQHAWPTDRTTYSMQPIHVGRDGKPMRWLEFTLTAQEQLHNERRVALDKVFISEPPTYHGGWTPIPPQEVDVKVVGEMAFFNLAQCPDGHDGTPLALVEMGTLEHDEHYPICRLNVDTSVIPENAPRKKVLNMDTVIAASTTSEANPGWGNF